MNFYNDNDSYVAEWLGNLIACRHLPQGTVDDRSIVEIDSEELRSFRQCHFFAGIGGWPYAIQLAGWPDNQEVWTASCPCQPLSSAGQRKGHADERHLWPAFYRLIAECRPATIFGEQVASKDGREWLAGVRTDLEGLGYAVGAADLCAASVGAPHIRQRLFWVASRRVADADVRFAEFDAGQPARPDEAAGARSRARLAGSSGTGGLGDASNTFRRAVSIHRQDVVNWHDAGRAQAHGEPRASGEVCGVATAADSAGERSVTWADERSISTRNRENPWSDAEWIPCLDGKARRIEPGTFPLANGVPARVGRLRGYGNAIVPQVAAQFIKAFVEC